MLILDTNVISEMLRPAPDAGVEAWLEAQDGSDLYLTAITAAELRRGVSVLPKGRRRTLIDHAVEGVLTQDFAERILPFDAAASVMYALIAEERRAAGRPISQSDAQIAAIARSLAVPVATRNLSDFQGCGIHLVDPWRSPR